MNDREAYWFDYYGKVAATGNAWLDLSNEQVQAQSFALALEASGPVHGRRCLDIGCGWGQISRALKGLGAAEVTGVDLIPETIAKNSSQCPDIRWLCGSLGDSALESQLSDYDRVFLVEVLQYLPLRDTLHRLWQRLNPGGRLIGVVPNAECPIVKRTHDRFGENYSAPVPADLYAALNSLDALETWAVRGAAFGQDQRLAPYEVSSWGRELNNVPVPPNRIIFAASKSPAPA